MSRQGQQGMELQQYPGAAQGHHGGQERGAEVHKQAAGQGNVAYGHGEKGVSRRRCGSEVLKALAEVRSRLRPGGRLGQQRG